MKFCCWSKCAFWVRQFCDWLVHIKITCGTVDAYCIHSFNWPVNSTITLQAPPSGYTTICITHQHSQIVKRKISFLPSVSLPSNCCIWGGDLGRGVDSTSCFTGGGPYSSVMTAIITHAKMTWGTWHHIAASSIILCVYTSVYSSLRVGLSLSERSTGHCSLLCLMSTAEWIYNLCYTRLVQSISISSYNPINEIPPCP